MAYEIKGRVKSVGDVVVVSDKFSKRQIAIETDGRYPQVIAIESSNDRNALLDGIGPGDTVTIQFDLRGREGRDGRIWNTLSLYKINVDSKGAAPSQDSWGAGNGNGDLPF
jgi:hypothetical protein